MFAWKKRITRWKITYIFFGDKSFFKFYIWWKNIKFLFIDFIFLMAHVIDPQRSIKGYSILKPLTTIFASSIPARNFCIRINDASLNRFTSHWCTTSRPLARISWLRFTTPTEYAATYQCLYLYRSQS